MSDCKGPHVNEHGYGFKVGLRYIKCGRCGHEAFGHGEEAPAPLCGCPPDEPTAEVTSVDEENGTVTFSALVEDVE